MYARKRTIARGIVPRKFKGLVLRNVNCCLGVYQVKRGGARAAAAAAAAVGGRMGVAEERESPWPNSYGGIRSSLPYGGARIPPIRR